MKLRIAGVLVAMAALAGCGGLRSDAVAERVYVLNPAAPAAGASGGVPGVLLVLRPAVQPGLDTERIALLNSANEMDYYAASRWGETLPKVITALAVQSLAGAGGFGTVVSVDRAVVASDYELLLTVRHFEAVYGGGMVPVARVAFECVLTTGSPRRVLGRCDAQATEPASTNRMGTIVAALEQAAQAALARVREQAVAAAASLPPAPPAVR